MSMKYYNKRFLVGLGLSLLLFFLFTEFSKTFVSKELSKQLSSQLERELHVKLFSDMTNAPFEEVKADEKSLRFYLDSFNKINFNDKTRFQYGSWYQLILPTDLSIYQIDGEPSAYNYPIGTGKQFDVTTINFKGSERKVYYYWDYDINLKIVLIYFVISLLTLYLVVFKRVPL